MNVAGQENRPIGLVEALISGLQGGTASAMEERDKRLKLIRDIEKERVPLILICWVKKQTLWKILSKSLLMLKR